MCTVERKHHLVSWHFKEKLLLDAPLSDIHLAGGEVYEKAGGGSEVSGMAGCIVRHHVRPWRQHLDSLEFGTNYKALQAGIQGLHVSSWQGAKSQSSQSRLT